MKTGPCVAFDVSVAGQDMNTTWGVSLNSGAGMGAGLTLGAGVGMQLVCGCGKEGIAGHRRHAGLLLLGVNMSMQGAKFLFY